LIKGALALRTVPRRATGAAVGRAYRECIEAVHAQTADRVKYLQMSNTRNIAAAAHLVLRHQAHDERLGRRPLSRGRGRSESLARISAEPLEGSIS
jgi:hypothetical protein